MNSRNINIGGKRLKVVIFNTGGRLYRANQGTFGVNSLASNDYRGAPMKYFTLNESELSAYTKYDKPYKKTWKPVENLTLIDILHRPTRDALAELIGTDDLNVSFPIRNGKVYRVSEEDEAYHDDNVLSAICNLGFDGYYMKAIERTNNLKGFHSEVGICGSSLHKLRLERVERIAEVPRAPTRKRRRLNNNNNNNNSPTKKRFRINRLGNNNTNRNNNSGYRLNFTRKIAPPSFLNFD